MKTKLLSDLDRDGFIFKREIFGDEFKNKVLNEASPSLETISIIKKILTKYELSTENTQINYEDVSINESNELHTHLIPADCQMIIWIPLTDNFKGRDFIYKSKNQHVNKHHPRYGDICFMKTNDLNFLHGVSKLETDTQIRTILVSINCNQETNESMTLNEKLEII